MIKNMTRKGLALGSAAALIVAGFVGVAPAQAATAVTLNASAGSQAATQNGILGQTFNLASTVPTGAAEASRVRYFVEGANASELVVEARFVTSLTSGDGYVSATDTDKTVGLNKAAVFGPATWTVGRFYQMNVSLTGVTATRTITITPFVDSEVQNDEIDTNEVKGTPITLTFHKASEVTATTTIAAVKAGDTALEATVALDKDINSAAIPAAAVNVFFAKNGTFVLTDNATSTKVATYDTVRTTRVASISGVTVDVGDVLSAQARIGGTAATDNSGSAAIVQAAAGTVSKLATMDVARNTFYRASGSASSDAVRAGAGTLVLSTTATSSTGAAVAGGVVTFTIEETGANSVDAAATISAGGKTLAGTPTTAQKIAVDVTTDADGKASLSVSYAGVKFLNTFDVTISAYGPTGVATAVGTSASLTKTFNVNDSVATAIVDVNKLGGANGDNPVHSVTLGGPVAIAYQVVDQFGQTPAGTHRLRVGYKTGGDAVNSIVPVAATGAANASFTDNSTVATTTVTTATVERQNPDDLTEWNAVGSVTETSTVSAAAALPAATRVTVTESPDSIATDTKNNVLSSAALATVDSRVALESVARPALGSQSILSGVVYGATGAVQAGASVTLSSPNLMFVTNAGTADDAHYSLGSTTIKTDANGAWGDVKVLSTVSGKHTVTVTSGSGSTTTDVFFGAAAHDAGYAVTITAPASVLPGSTLQVSALVTDKFGNPVKTGATADVRIVTSGPGLVVGTIPTETGDDGKVNFSVLMGTNDRGTFTVTVTYRSAKADTATTDLISATANVIVGSAAAVAGEARAWTRFLSATNELKIYARDVVNAGKIQFIVNGTEIAWIRATSAADPKLNVASDGMVRSVFVRDMLQGRNVIEIYEDGVRIERRIFTND